MDQQLLLHVMSELGATPQHLRACVRGQGSFKRACETLERLKVEARRRYKELAFRWHPDRNPGDPEAEAQFKVLGRVLEDVCNLKLRPPQPALQVIHFYQTSPFGGTVTTNTTTSVTSNTYDARRAVFIKFR